MIENAPNAAIAIVEKDGVAPRNYHSTSMYPEYFKIDGQWKLAEESRMDSCVVLCDDGTLAVVEARNLKKGDQVILGRTEKCEDGVYLHCNGFVEETSELDDQFIFRQGRSRETAYSCDYDKLYELLKYEKEHGNDMYEIFLGGSLSLVTIENPNADKEKELILFRDSFGSSIAPLLAEGYSKVTLVDLRYLRWERLNQFIDFTDQDVLFLYSTSMLNHNELK